MSFTLKIVNPPSGAQYFWADYSAGENYSGWLNISDTWSCPYGANNATDLRIYVVDSNYTQLYYKGGLGPIQDGVDYQFDCSTGVLSTVSGVPLTPSITGFTIVSYEKV